MPPDYRRLYEQAATTPREELEKACKKLRGRELLRYTWADLGFAAKFPRTSKEAAERIARRILDRHDTAARVDLGLNQSPAIGA